MVLNITCKVYFSSLVSNICKLFITIYLYTQILFLYNYHHVVFILLFDVPDHIYFGQVTFFENL